MHNLVHTLSLVLGGTMSPRTRGQGRGGTAIESGTRSRTAKPKPEPVESIGIEVPVHRLAEYVPASFTAASENEADPLNTEDARWYKTGEGKLMLVIDENTALEFNAESLCALTKRAESMSIVDVDDLLDLA
jgi:hypothetical protein